MTRILHVSDLHFGPHYLEAAGCAVLRLAEETAPDLVVASGDFTQRAKRGEYADARQFLDQLAGPPLIVVPGNHDVPLYRVWERATSPYGLYREYIRDELDYVEVHPDWVVVALNTTAPYRTVVNGVFRQWQLAMCREAFRAAPPDALKLVVAHHPLVAPADYHRGKIVHNAYRAAEAFARERVDMVIGGHLHRAYASDTRAAAPHCLDLFPTLLVYSGTTTSGRGRAGEKGHNSLNVIDVSPDEIRITQHRFQPDREAFVPSSTHGFSRQPTTLPVDRA